MYRSFALASLSLGLFAMSGPAFAHEGRVESIARASDDAHASDAKQTAAPAKDAGSIDGTVTAIEYRAGMMSVAAGARHLDVTILPSTNITGKGDGFRTIADIHKGAHVHVLLSQRGETYSAQIITLR